MKQLFLTAINTLLLLAGVLTQTGCSDDPIQNGQSSDLIRFSVASNSDWAEAKSGSTRGEYAPGYASVTRCSERVGDKAVYLHALSCENVESEVSPKSRGASINSIDGQSISVTAFAFDKWDDTLTPNFMVEEELSSPWETGHYWPEPGLNLQFFAHCPFSIEGWRRREEAGYPKYSYQVPADAASQSDIIVAFTPELSSQSKAEVSLNFKHALTRVSFTAAPDFPAGTVNSITLKGVYGAGVFSFGSGDWEELSAPEEFHNQIDKNVTSEGGPLLSEELTFMMIPQAFAEDSQASVAISFTAAADGSEQTFEFPLKGHEWGKGKRVGYRLSLTPEEIIPVFEVNGQTDALDLTFTYEGGVQKLYVKSYDRVISSSGETLRPVDWTFVTEDGEEHGKELAGDWYMAGEDEEDPEEEENPVDTRADEDDIIEILSLHAFPQEAVISASANDRLQAIPPLSEVRNLANHKADTYFDLTTNEETANCYIVNCAGTYSFPIVYGNSIKNSSANPDSYTSSLTASTTVLKYFKNVLGEGITSGEIEKDMQNMLKAGKWDNGSYSSILGDAVLVWQDYPDLISAIRLVRDADTSIARVEFSVDQSSIGQGNAVIAVRDNQGTILWSWHIWVTDYNPYSADAITFRTVNHSDREAFFTEQNIGWCEGSSSTYAGRNSRLGLRQPSTGITIPLGLNQPEHISESLGNNTYYQYGRKDPMIGASTNGKDKECYYTFPAYKWSYRVGKTTLKDGIANPHLSFPAGSSAAWLKKDEAGYANLWNAKGRTASSVTENYLNYAPNKTIYDPCPPGMAVPAPGDLDKLLDYNFKWSESFDGIQSATAPGLTFPATGFRGTSVSKPFLIGDSNLYPGYKLVRVWSWGTVSGGGTAYHLCARSHTETGDYVCIMHHTNCHTSSALPIRPIRDASSDIWK